VHEVGEIQDGWVCPSDAASVILGHPNPRRCPPASLDPTSRRQLGTPLTAGAAAVNDIAVSPDGGTIVAGRQDGTVRLWDFDTRRPLGRPLRGPTGFVNTVAFSPDGHILAGAGQDKANWLWDTDARRLLGPPLKGHADVIDTVAFSADGKTPRLRERRQDGAALGRRRSPDARPPARAPRRLDQRRLVRRPRRPARQRR
jgi:WD domain, G-beta repeat